MLELCTENHAGVRIKQLLLIHNIHYKLNGKYNVTVANLLNFTTDGAEHRNGSTNFIKLPNTNCIKLLSAFLEMWKAYTHAEANRYILAYFLFTNTSTITNDIYILITKILISRNAPNCLFFKHQRQRLENSLYLPPRNIYKSPFRNIERAITFYSHDYTVHPARESGANWLDRFTMPLRPSHILLPSPPTVHTFHFQHLQSRGLKGTAPLTADFRV